MLEYPDFSNARDSRPEDEQKMIARQQKAEARVNRKLERFTRRLIDRATRNYMRGGKMQATGMVTANDAHFCRGMRPASHIATLLPEGWSVSEQLAEPYGVQYAVTIRYSEHCT